MHEDVQFSGNIYAHLKFTVYGRKQTYTRVLQCSPASVGLAQARPNDQIPTFFIEQINVVVMHFLTTASNLVVAT